MGGGASLSGSACAAAKKDHGELGIKEVPGKLVYEEYEQDNRLLSIWTTSPGRL
jgi:hypothetical protein